MSRGAFPPCPLVLHKDATGYRLTLSSSRWLERDPPQLKRVTFKFSSKIHCAFSVAATIVAVEAMPLVGLAFSTRVADQGDRSLAEEASLTVSYPLL